MTTPAAEPAEPPPSAARDQDHEPAEESASSEAQLREAESLDAKSTYEVIRREGKKELARSSEALFWSGLAAGLSMGFSFLAEGLLRAHLPDAPWRPLVAKLGYSVGFLIVILGSQQLFTENTLTPMVPLLAEKKRAILRDVLRLWAVVFAANMLGALIFALALGRLAVVEPETYRALSDLAAEAMRFDFWATLLHAVYAGWIIAQLVWMLPAAESAKIPVILLMTCLIGVGGGDVGPGDVRIRATGTDREHGRGHHASGCAQSCSGGGGVVRARHYCAAPDPEPLLHQDLLPAPR